MWGRLGQAAWLVLFFCFVGLFGLAVWNASKNQPHQAAIESGRQTAKSDVDNRPPDERLAIYTLWLERFTGALVVISAIQIFFLIRADSTARIVANAAKTSADAQKATLVAMARPKIAVRRIVVTKMTAGEPIRIRYLIVNAGGTPATILRRLVSAGIYQGTSPSEVKYPNAAEDRESVRLVSGASVLLMTGTAEAVTQNVLTELRHFTQGGIRLFCYGYIRYADDSGTERRMGFLRMYGGDQRFSPVDDPDHEYAD